MKCPFCLNKNTKVIDKRDITDQAITWRRRECLKCKKRFTTYEKVELNPIIVVKRDGRREHFNKEKLIHSIQRACEKRKISIEKINEICDEIETKIKNLNQREIKTKKIGSLVLIQLKKIDLVAFIRFASVYYSFENIKEFENIVSKLKTD
jgi:transcriptional repressor NrdR